MKKLFLFTLLIFLSSALWASSKKDAKQILCLLPPLLEQEIKSVDSLPVSLSQSIYPLFLSGQKTGALAEYKKEKDKIFIFKKPLKKWLAYYGHQPDATHLLAKCFAPVYLHELSHARDGSFGKKNNFSWPITVSDEYVAVFWQVYFIKEKLRENPNYYQDCSVFMPKSDFLHSTTQELEKEIIKHYPFLPPPMTQNNIEQLLENQKISYLGFSFAPKRVVLSLKSFFTKGGSWLEIKSKDLHKLKNNQHYLSYTEEKGRQMQEMNRFF